MGITKLLALILIVYGIRTLYIKMLRDLQTPQKNADFSSEPQSSGNSAENPDKKMEDVSDGEYKEVSP